MGLPGGGRNPISPRILRHFNVIAVNEFDDATYTRIYTCITDWCVNCTGPQGVIESHLHSAAGRLARFANVSNSRACFTSPQTLPLLRTRRSTVQCFRTDGSCANAFCLCKMKPCRWARRAKLSDALSEKLPGVVAATIEVYNTIRAELLPTPAKSHYLYNMRDLSKLFQVGWCRPVGG